MESYVERWAREQKEAAQKEAQKEQKSRKPQKGRKAVSEDGTDTRSKGHEAQAESNGGE